MAEHTVVTSQQIDGWRAVCACGWTYANTSPSITLRAAELHGGDRGIPQPPRSEEAMSE